MTINCVSTGLWYCGGTNLGFYDYHVCDYGPWDCGGTNLGFYDYQLCEYGTVGLRDRDILCRFQSTQNTIKFSESCV